MNLDIEALRLTGEELEEEQGNYRKATNRQLAKDWWGFRDWLIGEEEDRLAGAVFDALEQANIERPKD